MTKFERLVLKALALLIRAQVQRVHPSELWDFVKEIEAAYKEEE